MGVIGSQDPMIVDVNWHQVESVEEYESSYLDNKDTDHWEQNFVTWFIVFTL